MIGRHQKHICTPIGQVSTGLAQVRSRGALRVSVAVVLRSMSLTSFRAIAALKGQRSGLQER